MASNRVLIPGETCWRVAHADRFACIVDGADYFYQVKSAMLEARRRIMLIGWDFDTRMTFEPGDATLEGPNQLGELFSWLLQRRSDLEILLLKANLNLVPAFQAIWSGITPVALLNWRTSDRIQFAVDGAHPAGAVHHQKIVVVDDAMGFCGGIDLTVDRWDTRDHEPDNRFRRALGRAYGPRHEVAAAVDGEAARLLGEVARARWESATGRHLEPIDDAVDRWPPRLDPLLRAVDVGIARTVPALRPGAEVREVEALNLAAVAAARQTIYLENQYLASRKLVEALAARLRESDGPEVVVVMPRNSESPLERTSMDTARHELLQLLWAADDHRRLGVYWPVTHGDTAIYVHSKVAVIDDRLLRIGSSNLNNRSMGFDTECDVAVEAHPFDSEHDDLRQMITSVRNGLIAEHLGVSIGEFERAEVRNGSVVDAIEQLRGHGRTLRQFTDETVAGEAGPLAENELMDPDRVPRSLPRTLQRFITGLTD